MIGHLGDQLRRLRVANETGVLPRDLGVWLIDELARVASDNVKREARDQLLREAGELIGGSAWARAHRIAAELGTLNRRRRDEDPIGRAVRQAVELDPRCPTSHRQILRILQG